MNETLEKNVVQDFAAFTAENGPGFIYGHIDSPYSGCWHLNGIAFVHGDRAYVTADLKQFSGYKGYVAKSPFPFKELAAGCIMAEELENVLSPARYGHDLEFHPIAELAENTPYALYQQIITMAEALGMDVSGQFKCACCGDDFAGGGECHYLEGDFKGNGGIGIEVGAPVCEECYYARRCGYCGSEVAPEMNGAFGEEGEHCQYCADPITCDCGEEVDPRCEWDADPVYAEAYNAGHCRECYIQTALGELMAEEYDKAADATGNLFA
jgi:hypothetical protein